MVSGTFLFIFSTLFAHNTDFSFGMVDESACGFGSEIVLMVPECDESFPFSVDFHTVIKF